MLEIDVRRSLGEFTLEARLSAPASGVLVLVGESGSGKTTLLRLVAGLLAPDHGRIAFGGQVLARRGDGESESFVPAHRRPVGYVAQDYALFPHLDARDNVAFGLRASRLDAREARTRADHALDRLGIRDLAGLRPHQLSGGQQQRVALARALVLDPAILLLDEPLAALDLGTRRSVRARLRALFEERTGLTIYVTHSPSEGLAFGDHIAVLERGRVSQQGTRDELLHRPRTRYVADFIGTNLFHARAGRPENGLTPVEVGVAPGQTSARLAAAGAGFEGDGFAVVDPREITLSLEPPSGSARNALRGKVVELQPEPPSGERVRVSLSTEPPLVAELTRAAVETLGLTHGLSVTASFKATGVRLFE